jgi:Xaa-Pro aminopeptidase
MSERAAKKHRLIEIDWPEFGDAACPPRRGAAEYIERIASLRRLMEERELTHAVVYGDREHFANLMYLTGFDPRFEESLLIVSASGKPLIVVGNECEGYLPISPLIAEGLLRFERFQSFSLLSQPRGESRPLEAIFAGEGIGPGSAVGCVGWKYFLDIERGDAAHALDIPSYIADTLRDLAGRDRVVNATDLLMHPGYGLRSFCSAADIAYFEYTNVKASESLKRMIFGLREGLREGMTDHAVVELARMNGEPTGCHPTFCTGANANLGLSGPSGETIRRGQPLAANISYYGSNICRAAWIAESAKDLPTAAQDYVERFAGPYFEVLGDWFQQMQPGVLGGEIWSLVQQRLPFDLFGIYLNPGHLIHMDEWVSSPIYRGSTVPLHSGMAMQVDVIPSSPVYYSTRMEDGIVLADAALRGQIERERPECHARIQARRRFMIDVLGYELPDEVLPLSNMPAIVAPFLLAPNTIFALEA